MIMEDVVSVATENESDEVDQNANDSRGLVGVPLFEKICVDNHTIRVMFTLVVASTTTQFMWCLRCWNGQLNLL